MKEIRTLYTWLGIEEDATTEQIKVAYREKARLHHPDRGGDVELFKKINQAHEVLTDSEQRKRYDRKVRSVKMRVKLSNMKDSVFGTVQDLWSDLEESFDDGWTPPNTDYHAEQRALEIEWQKNFARLINEYRQMENMNASNLETILHSTDVLLSSLIRDDKLSFGQRSITDDPIELKVDASVPFSEQASSVLTDLKDTISKAEQLVRMFNRITK